MFENEVLRYNGRILMTYGYTQFMYYVHPEGKIWLRNEVSEKRLVKFLLPQESYYYGSKC